MRKIFLTLLFFIFVGLLTAAPSFAYSSFTASNVSWNPTTGQLDFDTNIDLTQDISTFCNGFCPEIFDIVNISEQDYWTTNRNFAGNINCTSSHCTIYNLYTDPNQGMPSDCGATQAHFELYDVNDEFLTQSQIIPWTGTCPTNQPPTVNSIPNSTINEGSTYTASGSFTDSDSTSWTAKVDYGDGSGIQNLSLSGQNFSLSHQYTDEGTYTVTVKVTDNQGAIGTGTATVIVNDVAPSVGTINLTPTPIKINTSTTFSASFMLGDAPDTVLWKWGDTNTSTGTVTESNGSGSVTNTHTYTTLGSYTLQLLVTNNNNLTGSSQAVIAVIPSGGLVQANLSHTNYNGANFSNQDLTKVNGTNAQFQNVNFSNATLTQANFSGSNLSGSNFTNADLTKANLSNTNLTNVNFTGANLTQANLSGTTLTGVSWSNTTCPDGTNSNNDGNTCVGHL